MIVVGQEFDCESQTKCGYKCKKKSFLMQLIKILTQLMETNQSLVITSTDKKG